MGFAAAHVGVHAKLVLLDKFVVFLSSVFIWGGSRNGLKNVQVEIPTLKRIGGDHSWEQSKFWAEKAVNLDKTLILKLNRYKTKF